MIDPELLSILWCPGCQSHELSPVAPPGQNDPAEGRGLFCSGCGATFPVESGFPVLVPEGVLTSREWEVWRAHLAKFQARREARIENPDQPITKLASRTDPQPAFADFTGIEHGAVLDVGCGPGKFRFHLDSSRVSYVGLDPLHLPEVRDFPFVQGLAEYLPFRNNSFTDVVALAALDHFRNLDRFLSETRRVLVPDGRLHVLQSVHELGGPMSAVKMLAHKVKDALEDRWTDEHHRDVPKHLAEFTRRSLLRRIGGSLDFVSSHRYSARWYSPDKLFLTFAARPRPTGTRVAQTA